MSFMNIIRITKKYSISTVSCILSNRLLQEVCIECFFLIFGQTSLGVIIPGDDLDFYKLLFIKKNIIDEKIDPVYAEISSCIHNRNYRKGFEILANEYESRNIDRRMNLIVNKGIGSFNYAH